MWLSRYFQLKLCTRHTCTGKENLVAPTAAVEVSNYTLLYHAGLVLQRILATLVKLWPVYILPRPSQAKTTHRKSKELAMHWGITRRVIPVICCTQVWVLHGYQLESLISLPTSTVKWTCILWTPLLLDTDNNIKPLCYTKPAINGHFKGFSHWPTGHCAMSNIWSYTVLQKILIINYYCTIYWNLFRADTLYQVDKSKCPRVST